jgi:hypothetical protein
LRKTEPRACVAGLGLQRGPVGAHRLVAPLQHGVRVAQRGAEPRERGDLCRRRGAEVTHQCFGLATFEHRLRQQRQDLVPRVAEVERASQFTLRAQRIAGHQQRLAEQQARFGIVGLCPHRVAELDACRGIVGARDVVAPGGDQRIRALARACAERDQCEYGRQRGPGTTSVHWWSSLTELAVSRLSP